MSEIVSAWQYVYNGEHILFINWHISSCAECINIGGLREDKHFKDARAFILIKKKERRFHNLDFSNAVHIYGDIFTQMRDLSKSFDVIAN